MDSTFMWNGGNKKYTDIRWVNLPESYYLHYRERDGKKALTRKEDEVGYNDVSWMSVTQNYIQWKTLNLKVLFHCHAVWLVTDSVSVGTI
jgi:hypothetical protein